MKRTKTTIALKALQIKAKKAAFAKGHIKLNWIIFGPPDKFQEAMGICPYCQMDVLCNPEAMYDKIEGGAVGLECPNVLPRVSWPSGNLVYPN